MRFLQNLPQRKVVLSAFVMVGAIGTVLLASYLPNAFNDIRQRAQSALTTHMVHVTINAQDPSTVSDSTFSVEPQFLKPEMKPVLTRSYNNSGVTVRWNTIEPAKTQIEYGTTTSYGQSVTVSTQLATSHTGTITNLLPGTTYNYRLIATDATGNISKSSNQTLTTVTDTNITSPPKLIIKSPTNNQTVNGTDFNITYSSSGNPTDVDHVHFHVDDGPAIMDLTYDGSFQLSAPLGTHKITGYLVRYDHSKIDGTDTEITITNASPSDNIAPNVSLVGLTASSTLLGKINLKADATDNEKVAKVQFFVDGTQVGPDVTTTPYAYLWDSLTVQNGSHTIQAKATDAAGNVTSSNSVTITIQNDATAAQVGKWVGPGNWPIVTVHASLLYTGDLLIWDAWEQPVSKARLVNLKTGVFTNVDSGRAMFCSGQTQLPDGRIVVAGGYSNNKNGGLDGITSIQIFDPVTKKWSAGKSLQLARWYPTMTTLSDGRAIVFSGVIGSGKYADVPEIYNGANNTTAALTSVKTPELRQGQYPYSFHLPTGNVMAMSPETKKLQLLNPNTQSWTPLPSTPIGYGSAVQYQPGKILMSGGGIIVNANAAPNSAVIDLNNPNPTWRTVASMKANRYLHNFVMLPDGKVLAVGGSSKVSNTAVTGALSNEIWDPATEQWTTVASMKKLRMYHSVALLLPNGTVLAAGGGKIGDPPDQTNAEIYSPPYLFHGARPTISSAPTEMQYGSTITVQTSDAATINKISIISLPSVTHGFNMNQNFFNLDFQKGTNTLAIKAPSSSTIAPPGYYMLFILNSAGVPSEAKMIKVTEGAVVQPTIAPTQPPIPTPDTNNGGPTSEDIFTSFSDTRVKVVAYADEATGKITIKAQNTSKDPFTFSSSLQNISVTKLEQFVTDSTASLLRKADVPVTNNQFSLQIAPESTVVLTTIESPASSIAPTATTAPSPTPTLGLTPTVTPSKAPTPTTQAPTNIPTVTLMPTATIVPNSGNQTTLNVNIFLQGIGKGGDNSNPNGLGNQNPIHPQQQLTVEFLNNQQQSIMTKQGLITYQPTTGSFTGIVDITGLPFKAYSVRLSTPTYLKRIVTVIVNSQATSLQAKLTAGDANNDNRLSIQDYNVIIDCYSDAQAPRNCADPKKKEAADLDDDGKVNQIDINLLFRQFFGQSGN